MSVAMQDEDPLGGGGGLTIALVCKFVIDGKKNSPLSLFSAG